MYFKWNETVLDLGAADISRQLSDHYNHGYILGRVQPGYMWQTRSLRLNLKQFSPNSENRRVMRKFAGAVLQFRELDLPLASENYSWQLHSLGKNFYQSKFPDEKFSASKIKELVTTNYGFNKLLVYDPEPEHRQPLQLKDYHDMISRARGFNIGYLGENYFHYCFPFYDLKQETNNIGMYMMLHAILWSQLLGLEYIYLGGVTRRADKYKLQFNGLEWFDGNSWQTDMVKLKSILQKS